MIWLDPYPDLAPPGKKDFCTAEPFIAALAGRTTSLPGGI
jgi:hypothetical protein